MNSNQTKYWLSKERLGVYPKFILAILLLSSFGIYLFLKKSGSNFYFENDFSIFWTVSRLSLEGKTILAYDYLFLLERVRETAPVINSRWFYFPTYDLLILPLGLLPYGLSFAVFMTATYLAYAATIWRILPYKETLWWLAAFGGTWLNLRFGQNGFITAALVGVGLLNFHKRPLLCAICIGTLSIKPHLAILFPFALIASKAWKTLTYTIFTTLFFLITSTYVIGLESLTASLTNVIQARELIENPDSIGFWQIMPTFFAFCKLLGLSNSISYLIHYVVATFAATSVWIVWRSPVNQDLKNVVFILGTLLISPYLHIYDLTWLALAIAWTTKFGLHYGWKVAEREMLIAVWLMPFIDVPISRYFNIQIGPIVTLIFLLFVLQKIRFQLSKA
jgi:hypothetical protein